MRAWIVVLVLAACGCYRSHDRDAAADAGYIEVDAGEACAFAVRTLDGTDVRCTIPARSIEGCTEAAVCLCDARRPMTEVDRIRCAGWELTPRGAVTFADFCTLEAPASATMTEALDGYFGGAVELTIGDACAGVPALLGPRPFDGCGFLAEQVCPCAAAPCDLDGMLGRACLTLTHAEVACVLGGVGGNACAGDLPALVRACGG